MPRRGSAGADAIDADTPTRSLARPPGVLQRVFSVNVFLARVYLSTLTYSISVSNQSMLLTCTDTEVAEVIFTVGHKNNFTHYDGKSYRHNNLFRSENFVGLCFLSVHVLGLLRRSWSLFSVYGKVCILPIFCSTQSNDASYDLKVGLVLLSYYVFP